MNSDFSAKKILTGEDVLCAAVHRIEWLFETFSSVCLSFSGGKDSTVLLQVYTWRNSRISGFVQ